MKLRELWALVGLALLGTACAGRSESFIEDDEPDPVEIEAAPEGCRNDLGEGADLKEGQTIAACGLAPGSRLFGVQGSLAHVLTPGGSFLAVDLRTGGQVRLYSTRVPRIASAPVPRLHAGEIFFHDRYERGPRAGTGLLAVSAVAPTMKGDFRLLAPLHGARFAGEPSFNDGRDAYAGSFEDGKRGPLMHIDLETGGELRMTTKEARPVALSDTYVYYMASGLISRMPRSGGTPELVTRYQAAAACCDRNFAADDEYIYFPRHDRPQEVVRASPGAEPEDAFVGYTDFLCGLPDPEGLQIDEDWLYFRRGTWLQRVPLTGSYTASEATTVTDVNSGAAFFDRDHIYVTVDRGGKEFPREAVIVQVKKSSLKAPE